MKKYNVYRNSCEINVRDLRKAIGFDFDEDIVSHYDEIKDYIKAKELHFNTDFSVIRETYDSKEEALKYFDDDFGSTYYEGYAQPYYVFDWLELYEEDEEDGTQLA